MSNVDLNAPVNQSETANELGKRPVKLTVKALEEKILSHQKERNLRIKKLYKLRKEVEQLMLSKENVSDVQIIYDTFLKLSVETTELHESLKPLLPKEEMSKQNQWFEFEMNSNTEIIKRIKEWLLDIKEQSKGVDDDGDFDDDDEVDSAAPLMTVITDEIGPNDSVSNVGGKRCTSASCSSHRSLKSSTSSAYLKAEAERAALLARAATLKEKHELEVQEEQIRQKKEVLELQSQIAVHTAKVKVLKYRGSDVQSSSAHSDGMNSYLKRSKYKSSLRSSAMEFVPQSSSYHFNHPPKGGSKATVSMETCLKDSSHQSSHPPEGGSKTTVSRGHDLKKPVFNKVEQRFMLRFTNQACLSNLSKPITPHITHRKRPCFPRRSPYSVMVYCKPTWNKEIFSLLCKGKTT